MEKLYRIRSWILSILGLGRKNSDLSDEIESHIALQTDLNIEAGMSPQAARREAMRRFGNIEYFKEEARDAWGTRVVADLIRDVRYSARSLWKSKGFSLAVIVTLALCIGVNATFLSALYSFVIKPLPVREPERLVQLFNGGKGDGYSHSSWNQYREFRERIDLFEGCALRYAVTELMTVDGSVQRVRGQEVSGDFFEVMGAKPLLGRFFLPEECDPANPGAVMVLTQTAWENQYDADPGILGSRIRIDDFADGGVLYTIIGVAERSMEVFDANAKYFAPFKFFNKSIGNPARTRYLFLTDLWIRLKPGLSREAALDQIYTMDRRWYEETADEQGRRSYERYDEYPRFDIPHPLERYLYLLEGGSLLVLLVGCFNVMNLVLNRAAQKRHELSVRNALGAGKQTLRRLLLVENGLVATSALGLGAVLALVGVYTLNHYLSILSPNTISVEFTGKIVATSLAFTLLMAAGMGLLPLEILRKAGWLKSGDSSQRTASASGLSRRLSHWMVVGQVAIAFVMLIGAALLVRSFQNVLAVDPGFKAKQVVQGRLDWSAIGPFYKKRAAAKDLKQRIHAAMMEIPGVESVSFIMSGMFSEDLRPGPISFFVRGEPADKSFLRHGNAVSPEFFTTMGIPIIEGRNFTESDDGRAVIVDELFARRFFPDRSPIGTEISNQILPEGEPWPRIVGVAARANIRGLEERDDAAIIYVNRPVNVGDWEYTILLRSSRPAAGVIREMQSKLREIDPRLPLSYMGTLENAIDEMLVGRKGVTLLLAVFAVLALFLSLLGVYAVLAYDVSQRRREIGIRRAIGADRSSVLKMILRQGASKTGIGLALGFLASLYFTRFLENQLFDVTVVDPWTYLATLLIFLLVALAASYMPARRAVRVDPLESLRLE